MGGMLIIPLLNRGVRRGASAVGIIVSRGRGGVGKAGADGAPGGVLGAPSAGSGPAVSLPVVPADPRAQASRRVNANQPTSSGTRTQAAKTATAAEWLIHGALEPPAQLDCTLKGSVTAEMVTDGVR